MTCGASGGIVAISRELLRCAGKPQQKAVERSPMSEGFLTMCRGLYISNGFMALRIRAHEVEW